MCIEVCVCVRKSSKKATADADAATLSNILCSRCSCALCFMCFQWCFNIRRARFSICVCDSICISLYLYAYKKFVHEIDSPFLCLSVCMCVFFLLLFHCWCTLFIIEIFWITSYPPIKTEIVREREIEKQKLEKTKTKNLSQTKNKVLQISFSLNGMPIWYLFCVIWFLLFFLSYFVA